MKRELKEAESPEKTGKKTKRDREKRDHHWRWLPRMFIKPRGTLAKVNDQDQAVWFAPLLILAVMVLLAVVFAAPIKRVNIQTGATIPEDFQWWSQERQQQFLQAQQNHDSQDKHWSQPGGCLLRVDPGKSAARFYKHTRYPSPMMVAFFPLSSGFFACFLW